MYNEINKIKNDYQYENYLHEKECPSNIGIRSLPDKCARSARAAGPEGLGHSYQIRNSQVHMLQLVATFILGFAPGWLDM